MRESNCNAKNVLYLDLDSGCMGICMYKNIGNYTLRVRALYIFYCVIYFNNKLF